MKRAATSNPQGNSGPSQRTKPNQPGKYPLPPARKRRNPQMNPQDSAISLPTISIKEAKKREEKRKRMYASSQHNMPLIPIEEAQKKEEKRKEEYASKEEAQKKDKQRQMNHFTKDNINYNPNRNFPQRINDSAILANKRPPRRNKTRKKRDTSLKSLKNRPPGMGGRRKTRRKTRRKKRRKTKTKKKRRKKKKKTRRRR
tara:strand:- start:785 stop:1384 length:600 start_codon:yes stop_codon:yes gene_type:complete